MTIVATVTLPLALVLIVTKVHKLMLVESAGGWGPAAVSSDVLFITGWVVCWLGLLHVTNGVARRLVATLCHVVGFLAIVMALAEHVFVVETGTYLDWYMIGYAWSQLHDLDKVILSEVDWRIYALGVVVIALAFVPLLLRRLPPFRSWNGSSPVSLSLAAPRARTLVAAVALTLLLATGMVAAGVPKVEGVRRSAVPALVGEAITTMVSPGDEAPRSDDAWMVAPLELTPSADHDPHNVVVIVMESVRATATTVYNPKLPTTPFLAKLAKTTGRHAEHAYTVVPHTSKALVASLCGIYPKVVTPVDEATTGGIPTKCLARLLREQGYATAFFQPAEEHYEARHVLVSNMGFETFRGKESLANPAFHESSYFGYEDDVMVEPSLEWAAKQKRPFFLSYLTLTSHHTYQIPEGFPEERYSEKSVFNRYLNTVRYTDRFVEKVYRGLEARGLLDDTIFVVLGDHGEGFGEHGRHEHDTVIYEEGVRVPLLIAGPNTGPRGQSIDGLRQITDVVPTVIDALGFDVRGGSLSGRSLLGPGHEEVFLSCWYHRYCMARLEGTKKFVYHYDRRPTQVFDLEADPGERQDIAETIPEDDVSRSVGRMKEWRQRAVARYAVQRVRSYELLVRHEPAKPEHELDMMLGDSVRLRGYDLGTPTAQTGRSLEITYYFEAVKDVEAPWELFVHIASPSGRVVRNADHVPAEGSHPISRWKKGEHITDPQRIFIQHGTPSGPYEVLIGLWRRDVVDGPEARALPEGDPGRITDDRRVRVTSFNLIPGPR